MMWEIVSSGHSFGHGRPTTNSWDRVEGEGEEEEEEEEE